MEPMKLLECNAESVSTVVGDYNTIYLLLCFMTMMLLLPYVVGHVGGDLEGELDKASYLARLMPWGLVD